MPVFSRPALLLTLLALTGAVSHARAADGTLMSSTSSNTVSPGGDGRPGVVPVQDVPASVTVQPGDTAYSLARRYGLSVDTLLALNGLDSPNLRVGQVLRVRDLSSYTVQRGDTLYSLSRRFGVSVDTLLAANTLPKDVILEVGQVLRVPASAGGPALAQAMPAPVTAVTPPAPTFTQAPTLPVSGTNGAPSGDWRATALALLGVPYVYGGNTPGGLDCSGLVVQVFAPLGVQLPRRSADQARTGVPVSPDELQPGDLVFFDTVGKGEVTHVGIYLGDNQFVNANSYKGQVTVDQLLGDVYWSPRLLGARRVLPSAAPVYGVGH